VPLIPLIVALFAVCALVLATPLLLLLRYRAGTARRVARGWVVTVNLLSMFLSAGLFIWIAAMTNFWVPRAFGYSVIGMLTGFLLGLLGLAATRWEKTAMGIYYTPNRWLVLFVTLAVATRMVYGLWRIWHAWRTTGHDTSWLAVAGIPGSMAVGALVIGYYLAYSVGLSWRLKKFC
jgi:hypothetical protein